MRQFLIACGIVISLVACQNVDKITGQPVVSGVEIVDRSMVGVENSFTLALITAKVYTDLPRCGTGPKICSQINVVKKIREYAIKAHDAVLMARKNQAMIGLAVSAVSNFDSMIPKS